MVGMSAIAIPNRMLSRVTLERLESPLASALRATASIRVARVAIRGPTKGTASSWCSACPVWPRARPDEDSVSLNDERSWMSRAMATAKPIQRAIHKSMASVNSRPLRPANGDVKRAPSINGAPSWPESFTRGGPTSFGAPCVPRSPDLLQGVVGVDPFGQPPANMDPGEVGGERRHLPFDLVRDVSREAQHLADLLVCDRALAERFCPSNQPLVHAAKRSLGPTGPGEGLEVAPTGRTASSVGEARRWHRGRLHRDRVRTVGHTSSTAPSPPWGPAIDP